MLEGELKSEVEAIVKLHRSGAQLSPENVEVLLSHIDMLEFKFSQAQRKIEELHNQYAHEGGKPQIMTVDILKKWFDAIDVPRLIDVYQTNVPNVFYATFRDVVYPEHRAQINALAFDITEARGTLRNRYMLKWRTPPNDEY